MATTYHATLESTVKRPIEDEWHWVMLTDGSSLIAYRSDEAFWCGFDSLSCVTQWQHIPRPTWSDETQHEPSCETTAEVGQPWLERADRELRARYLRDCHAPTAPVSTTVGECTQQEAVGAITPYSTDAQHTKWAGTWIHDDGTEEPMAEIARRSGIDTGTE